MFLPPDGQLLQNVDIGVKVRGLLESDEGGLVYNDVIHNRTRTLKCAEVCVALCILVNFSHSTSMTKANGSNWLQH